MIDECHHVSSNVYRNVLRNIDAKYIFSFSATPQRRDQLDKIFYMYLGNLVYKSDKQEIIKNRNYEQILLPRITKFKIIDNKISYTEICNELYQNEKRNYLIVQDVNTEIKDKRNIILLTDRKEHIQILYNQLKYNEYDIFCMSSDSSIRERKIIREKIS